MSVCYRYEVVGLSEERDTLKKDLEGQKYQLEKTISKLQYRLKGIVHIHEYCFLFFNNLNATIYDIYDTLIRSLGHCILLYSNLNPATLVLRNLGQVYY